MAELLALHEAKIKTFRKLQVVDATFLNISGKQALFDVGGKSQGVCRDDSFLEAKSFIKKMKPGQTAKALVLEPETSDGMVLLSFRHAAKADFWDRVKKYLKEEKTIEVLGQSASHHGLMVSVESETAFIPSSQFSAENRRNLDDLVGRRIQVKVIDVDESSQRIVLSERAVSEADDIALMKKALSNFKKGEKHKGVVTTIVSFGAFVEIETMVEDEKVLVEGLVHISELSWSKVETVEEVLEEGQSVEVTVLGIEKDKLALSMKETKADPWENIQEKYQADDKLTGKIVRISDFGVFVELEEGVEGLIHMTKIAPGTSLKEGQEIKVYVEEVDAKNKKISLGIVLTAAKPVGYR